PPHQHPFPTRRSSDLDPLPKAPPCELPSSSKRPPSASLPPAAPPATGSKHSKHFGRGTGRRLACPVAPSRQGGGRPRRRRGEGRSEEHTSELQSRFDL